MICDFYVRHRGLTDVVLPGHV